MVDDGIGEVGEVIKAGRIVLAASRRVRTCVRYTGVECGVRQE
jgi:hypothetical protein